MSRKRSRTSFISFLTEERPLRTHDPVSKATQDFVINKSLQKLEKNFNGKLEELNKKLEDLNSTVESEHSLRDTILLQQNEIFELKYFITNHMTEKNKTMDNNYFT